MQPRSLGESREFACNPMQLVVRTPALGPPHSVGLQVAGALLHAFGRLLPHCLQILTVQQWQTLFYLLSHFPPSPLAPWPAAVRVSQTLSVVSVSLCLPLSLLSPSFRFVLVRGVPCCLLNAALHHSELLADPLHLLQVSAEADVARPYRLFGMTLLAYGSRR